MTPAAVVGWAALAAASPSPPPVVTVSAPGTVEIRAGGKREAAISVTVAEGFHVQANPASEPYLIPLRLELAEGAGFRIGKPLYPEGRPYRLRGADRDLSTYEGTFAVRWLLEVPKDAPVGELTVEGALRYQACDTRVCLRPATVPFTLRVRILPSR